MTKPRVLATGKDKKGRTVLKVFVPGADDDALSIALRVLTYHLQRKLGVEAGGGFGGDYGYGVKFENDVFLMCPDYMDVECNCGHNEAFDVWVEGRKHAAGCYSTDVSKEHGRIRSKHRSGIDAAIKVRDRYPPFSKDADKAQKVVNRLSDAHDREDKAMRQALCRKHHIKWNKGWASMCHCTCGHSQAVQEWLAANPHAERCPIELPNFWHKPSGLKVKWYKWIGRDNEIEQSADVTLRAVLNACLKSIEAPSFVKAVRQYERAESASRKERAEMMNAMFQRLSSLPGDEAEHG